MATEVVVCVSTAAGQSRSPGSAAMFAHQYVNRLNTIAAKSEASSSGVIVFIASQTAP